MPGNLLGRKKGEFKEQYNLFGKFNETVKTVFVDP